MTVANEAPPTERQLRYLRALAGNTGTTFEYPATRAQASRQISRLRTISPAPRERNDEAGGAAYATAVHEEEVDGYGSSATWRVTPPPAVAFRRPPRVRDHVELARYKARGEERVLRLGNVDGVARIDDRPASGRGRVYLVERDFQDDEPLALDALIADYVAQAEEFDRVPMSGTVAAGESHDA
jgi:hypothetical protein